MRDTLSGLGEQIGQLERELAALDHQARRDRDCLERTGHRAPEAQRRLDLVAESRRQTLRDLQALRARHATLAGDAAPRDRSSADCSSAKKQRR